MPSGGVGGGLGGEGTDVVSVTRKLGGGGRGDLVCGCLGMLVLNSTLTLGCLGLCGCSGTC